MCKTVRAMLSGLIVLVLLSVSDAEAQSDGSVWTPPTADGKFPWPEKRSSASPGNDFRTAPPTTIRRRSEDILSRPEFRGVVGLRSDPGIQGERSFRNGNDEKRRDGGGDGDLDFGDGDGGGDDAGDAPRRDRLDDLFGNGGEDANDFQRRRERRNRDFGGGDDQDRSVESSPDFGGVSSVSGEGLGAIAQVLAYLVLAVVIGFIVYSVVKAIIGWRSDADVSTGTDDPASMGETNSPEKPLTPPGEIPVNVYLRRADELAGRHDYREAVSQLLLGAMSFVEREHLVEHRRGLTHRDYVRALRAHPELRTALRDLVKSYEPLGFGRREATASIFQEVRTIFRSHFEGGSTG